METQLCRGEGSSTKEKNRARESASFLNNFGSAGAGNVGSMSEVQNAAAGNVGSMFDSWNG